MIFLLPSSSDVLRGGEAFFDMVFTYENNGVYVVWFMTPESNAEKMAPDFIKWAKEKGLSSFVLGGGYGSDDGIFQYKLAIAPNGVRDFYIGSRIVDQASYDMLKALRTDPLNEDYFPVYRS